MQKWLADGLMVGLVTVAIGAGAAIVLPQAPAATLAGSGLGAVASSTLLAKRQSRRLALLTHQLEESEALLLATQAQVSVTQADVSDLWQQLDQEQASPAELTNQTTEDGTSEPEIDSQAPSSASSLQPHSPERVINWLATQKVSVEPPRNLEDDAIFNQHAIYLGHNLNDENRQPLLAPLLKQIKWAIAQNRGIQYPLKNSTQLKIRVSTQFCNSLYKDTLLASYFYSKDEKTIHAAIQDRGDVRDFFNGKWFERFICHRVCELLNSLELTYAFLMNPIIKFPNADRFELDLLFLVDQKPLLIECKTGGDFNAHLKKFSDHCKRLAIPPASAFLVILDLEDAQTERLSQFWKFKVVNQASLLPLIQARVS
jgi:hypothetical protein